MRTSIDQILADLTDDDRREIARRCLVGLAAEGERQSNSFWYETVSEAEWIEAIIEGLR